MAIIYGISQCDTVKRARAWFAQQGVEAEFHDFKKSGVPCERLATWLDAAGWELLLNRRGTTWRKLDPTVQAAVVDSTSAARLMREQPSLIKRPIVEWNDGRVTWGFDPVAWSQALG